MAVIAGVADEFGGVGELSRELFRTVNTHGHIHMHTHWHYPGKGKIRKKMCVASIWLT